MVLEGGLDWKAMGYNPADMDFAETRQVAAREIALAFGVPPMLLGIPGDNTYANYAEANLNFWRQTAAAGGAHGRGVEPLAVPPLRRRFAHRVRTDAVDALAETRHAMWSKLNEASFLTINEKRAAAGYGPVEGGDTV